MICSDELLCSYKAKKTQEATTVARRSYSTLCVPQRASRLSVSPALELGAMFTPTGSGRRKATDSHERGRRPSQQSRTSRQCRSMRRHQTSGPTRLTGATKARKARIVARQSQMILKEIQGGSAQHSGWAQPKGYPRSLISYVLVSTSFRRVAFSFSTFVAGGIRSTLSMT